MKTLNIAIAGSSGRMGRALLEAVARAADLRLTAALERAGNPYLEKDAGDLIGVPSNVHITDDLAAALCGSDVLVDFTRPEGTLVHIAICRENNIKMVIGTTGFSPEQKEALEDASKDIAIVFAPNMSVGVNVTLKLLEMAARALGEGYDIEIIEAHHRHKVDAPSGTGLFLGTAAAAGRGVELDQVSDRARDGITGPRREGHIGFAVMRGGSVAGDHQVVFAGEGERIEIGHRAETREIFARGAVKAALWLAGKPAGRYWMTDVLGLTR